MKNNNGKSRNARINKAAQLAYHLHKLLTELQGYNNNEHIDEKEIWKDARLKVSELNQCVHEANAYNNTVKNSK